jgi:hypothetical protein
MPDNQAQKNPNTSQPTSAGSQDQKKPETMPKDSKPSSGSGSMSGDKKSAGGSSSGAR